MLNKQRYRLFGMIVFAMVAFAFFDWAKNSGEEKIAVSTSVVAGEENASHDAANGGPSAEIANKDTNKHESPDLPESYAARDAGTVEFPNGIRIDPDWRPMPRPKNVDALNRRDVPLLIKLADDGDPYAARTLAMITMSCEGAPITKAGLEAEIWELEQTQSKGYSETEGEILAGPEELPIIIQQMRSGFERCKSARAIRDKTDTDFQKLAADNGSTVAMLDYGNSLLPENNDEARSYYTKAWLEGEPDALGNLSKLALRDYEDGSNPTGHLDSAAYFVAWATLMAERYRSMGGSIAIEEAERISVSAEERLNNLLPNQREIAVVQAIELVQQNDKCCLTYEFQ